MSKKAPTQKLSLIDGSFSPADAKELLVNLFTSKIQFHELRNFSIRERFGHTDMQAQHRIPALRQSREEAILLAQEAAETGKQLQITSIVEIKLIDHP